MPYTTLSTGLTIKVPTRGSTGWSQVMLDDTFKKIAAHDHTGSPNGVQISTNALVADAVNDTKVKLRNNQHLRGRNAADSADINIGKINTSNEWESGVIHNFVHKVKTKTHSGFTGSEQIIESYAGALTNNTPTTIFTFAVPADTLSLISYRLGTHKTSSGNANFAVYWGRRYVTRDSSSTLAEASAQTSQAINGTVPTVTITTSGTNWIIQLTGITAETHTWVLHIEYFTVPNLAS